jgi:tetratricopeptide (TPR) repeat protein
MVRELGPHLTERPVLFGSFAVLGLSLIWFGWRILKKGAYAKRPVGRSATTRLNEELHAARHPYMKDPRWSQYCDSVTAQEWQKAEEILCTLSPPHENAYVACATADLRTRQGDFAGAEQMLLLAQNQVSPEASVGVRLEIVRRQLQQGDVARAKETSKMILREMKVTAEKLLVMDQLACFPIMEGFRGFLDEAEIISAEALDVQPQNLTLKGTRGSILVELRRFDEAEALLHEVYTRSEADIDRGISAFYLGLIAKAKGNLARAKSYGKKAKRLYPEEWLKNRTDSELLG